MYGDSIDDTVNANDSTIKAMIDEWYRNYISSYTLQLEDTVFCNDRNYMTNGARLEFGAYTRLYTNKQPTLKCPNSRDKFTVNVSNGNGDLTYPVGLITADEIAYAGGVMWQANTAYYLYNKAAYQWTISPYYCSWRAPYGFTVGSAGQFAYAGVTDSDIVRPVISLKPGTGYISGDGTASSPFVIN